MSLADTEAIIRLSFFFGILLLVAIWELLAPRRALTVSKTLRWFSNLAIVFISPPLVRLVLPMLPVGMAVLAKERGWGLFNNFSVPYWLAVAMGAMALDCVIYFQHVMVHAVPLLWRVHSMHHTDMDLDVTSGLRFHPIEIIISMVIKLAAVVVIGAPALAVILFEVLLNGTAMFNHGNIYVPLGIDGVLRLLVVTPDMHRVHHSVIGGESNKNFGFNLPWWDRIFGTYRDQPEAGHEGMTIGLTRFQDAKHLALHRMLAHPFIYSKDKKHKEQ